MDAVMPAKVAGLEVEWMMNVKNLAAAERVVNLRENVVLDLAFDLPEPEEAEIATAREEGDPESALEAYQDRLDADLNQIVSGVEKEFHDAVEDFRLTVRDAASTAFRKAVL
jgi:hypothetical protein